MTERFSIVACWALALAIATGAAARAEDLVFLSTQMRPLEEATTMRNVILKDVPAPVSFVPDTSQQVLIHLQAEAQAGQHSVSLVGALHGELQPLAQAELLTALESPPVDPAVPAIPAELLRLARFGGAHPLYVPWMQGGYVMVANRKALPFLPAGADLHALSYDQLRQWGEAIQQHTGQRALGFPAGPQGLLARFFEGYLYPSYTGGVVTPFRSPEAEEMWRQFRALWRSVNPNATSYNFMQEPLLSSDVWVAFENTARVVDALRQHPEAYVVFPPPAGPHGRGDLSVVIGLAIARRAPDAAGAAKLIAYLTQPLVESRTAMASGLFPAADIKLPADAPSWTRLTADAIAATKASPDLIASVLPIGLGSKDGAFNKVYLDSFTRIVLRGEDIRAVLDHEAQDLRAVIEATGARCWQPDAPSDGPCPVR
jgi:multiple sugar transport system substrate-binding protein